MINDAINNKDNIMQIDLVLKMYNTKLFVTKSVGELIKGYEDPLLKLGKTLNKVKESMFSLTSGKNGTEWQRISINT